MKTPTIRLRALLLLGALALLPSAAVATDPCNAGTSHDAETVPVPSAGWPGSGSTSGDVAVTTTNEEVQPSSQMPPTCYVQPGVRADAGTCPASGGDQPLPPVPVFTGGVAYDPDYGTYALYGTSEAVVLHKSNAQEGPACVATGSADTEDRGDVAQPIPPTLP